MTKNLQRQPRPSTLRVKNDLPDIIQWSLLLAQEAILSMNRCFVFSIAIACGLASGCTSQQLYATGQSYQRNQCQKMPDQSERERCLSNAGTSHDDYKREADSGAK
jgi:hypothetical protein